MKKNIILFFVIINSTILLSETNKALLNSQYSFNNIDFNKKYSINNNINSIFGITYSGNIYEGKTSTSDGGVFNFNTIGGTFPENDIFENAIFRNNTAIDNGGAIYYQSSSTSTLGINNSLFEGNTANNGGAIYRLFSPTFISTEVLDINASIFKNNTSQGSGGALYLENPRIALIKDTSFIDNKASGNGGAIYYITGSSLGKLQVEVSAGKKIVWSGNKANGEANSIHFAMPSSGYSGATADFFVKVGSGGVLKMEDPMTSIIDNLNITQEGSGTWQVGGVSKFVSPNGVNIHIKDNSILEFLSDAQFDLSLSPNSDILFDINTSLVLTLNTNGNPIFIGDGITTGLNILSSKKTIIKIKDYTQIGQNIGFIVSSNLSGINIPSGIDVFNPLYKSDVNIDSDGNISFDVVRQSAKEAIPGISDYMANILDNYMGGSDFIDSILTSDNIRETQNGLLTASEITKSAGTLYANRVIAGAVDYELMYAINSKQALDQSASMFGNIPVSIWFSPLILIGSYSDDVAGTGIKTGSSINSYGGMVAADIALPFAMNMRFGVAGYFGLGFSKSVGAYFPTKNDLMYFGGSIYYNLSANNVRFSAAVSWIGMNNKVSQEFLEPIESKFLTHNLNASFMVAYDFSFVKNLFISPFVGGNYVFYYQPDFDTKNNKSVMVFSTKKAARHSIVIPVGLNVSYNFLLSGKHIITPSIRLNVNIEAYDSALKTKWIVPTSTPTGIDLTENEIIIKDKIGIMDMNFNLSWRHRNIMVYGDYNLIIFANRVSHFISGGLRWFF